MKAFDNTTTTGNEKAIRKGKRVPPDDVNLAFYKTPELSPEENLVIVDTSKVSENSIKLSGTGCKLFYADEVGTLVDEENNVVITDSSPAITDEFLQEEDFSFLPGSEYTNKDILPFEHRSRYFHIEKAGLSFAGLASSYSSESVKVVDKKGQEYPRYKIRLVPANIPGYSLSGDNWAYRVLVYLDRKDVEELYLRYSKVEIDSNGNITTPNTDYQEIVNPRSFFKQVPEEADVVDPSAFNKKIFATTPITADSVDIGRNSVPGVDGYKVYVPKKAVSDPRIYQLFRWRINVDFIQDRKTDPGSDVQTIKCGVLKLSTDTSTHADFALMNLGNSRFNASGVDFVNPNASNNNKETRSYWHVNLDTDDLTDFDLLLLAPKDPSFDLTSYRPKLIDFVKKHGGTLFFDTWSRVDLFKQLGGLVSQPVKPWSGANYAGSASTVSGSQSIDMPNLTLSQTSELLNANASLGGWDLDDVDYLTHRSFPTGRFAQFFDTLPGDGEAVVTSGGKALLVDRKIGSGRIIISTMANLVTTSFLFDRINNATLVAGGNPVSNEGYENHINGEGVEGAYKMLYNAALISTKSRALDSSDETTFSSSWRFSTKWKASWVINAFDGVLDDNEKQRNNFAVDAVDPDNGNFDPVWKRKLSTKSIEQLVEEELSVALKDDPVLKSRVNQSSRQYSIEVSNPKVETGSINPEDIPQAWTTAFSPKFTVPDNLAPYIVQEVVGEDGQKGIRPDFGPNEYTHREYPDTPYGGKVRLLNATSEEILTPETTTYTVTGTAVGTFDVTVDNPDIVKQVPVTTSTSVVKELSWSAAHRTWENGKGSPTDPGTKFRVDSFPNGFVRPYGIRTWQDYNYTNSKFGNGNLLWPYMGFQSRISKGSSGNLVKFVQTAINRFRDAGYLTVSKLSVDGQFGPLTESAVKTFQTSIKARYVDGIIDAETWWLIHAWIQRLHRDGKAGDNYLNWFDEYKYLSQHRISDGSSTSYAKRSWVSGGPSTVWDLIAITFDQQYQMEGVTITPHGIGNVEDIMFRAVHVQDTNSLKDFSAETCFLKNMKHRPKVGQKFTLPFAARKGNTLVVGIGQDKPYKSGSTSRYLGVQDIAALVRVNQSDTSYKTVIEDGGTSVVEYKENFTFTITGSVKVTADKDVIVNLEYPGGDNYKNVSNISFNSITVSNASVLATIENNKRARFTTQVIDTAQGSDVREGPAIPGGTFYSKTTNGLLDVIPETGWINKKEGVKLLCNKDGTPYGFPPLPTSTGSNLTRHYMSYTIIPEGNGPDTYMTFYDINQQEFITSATGEPEMSYLEYYSRGPQNIFIAVVSEYEVTEQRLLPDDLDAPRLPYKRAMPVYGVCVERGSEINLESPPGGLSIRDVWPIAVRTGQYRRKRYIRPRSEGKLSGYLSRYQDSEVQAVYSVPEAALDSGSAVYGPGKQDVVAEEPKVLDDKVIKVRQYPIHLAERYVRGTQADPVTPVLKVYKRDTVSDPWVELSAAEIKDYNTSTGEVFLRDGLSSLDTNLLKVDYTSEQPFYSMTSTRTGQKINLNVFLGMMDDYTDKPIYVYMVPHFVRDSSGQIISESYTERTLDITSDPGIFDSTSPDYNPLAVQLGVIYTSNATDINELAMFDTRIRGGGAEDGLTSQELTRIVSEAISYWDVPYPSTVSYSKQGYVLVRLPSAVKTYLEDERVRQTVARNLTAGAGFDIEYVD